jgi:hypothetical protein
VLEFRIIESRELTFGVCLLTLAGCQWGQQLYVAYDTKLGIDANVNTTMTSGSIDIGYDRRFITWVPRSVEVVDGDGQAVAGEDGNAKEVMSVLACSELRVGIISIDYYDESLATGRAATAFAKALKDPKNRKVAEDYFECFTKKRPNATEQGSDGGESR